MGRKKGHFRIVGYDGAGEAIRARVGPRVEPERARREEAPHRVALRRMLDNERQEQDREVRVAFGLPVR